MRFEWGWRRHKPGPGRGPGRSIDGALVDVASPARVYGGHPTSVRPKKSSEDLNRLTSRLTILGLSLVSRGASAAGSPRCLKRVGRYVAETRWSKARASSRNLSRSTEVLTSQGIAGVSRFYSRFARRSVRSRILVTLQSFESPESTQASQSSCRWTCRVERSTTATVQQLVSQPPVSPGFSSSP